MAYKEKYGLDYYITFNTSDETWRAFRIDDEMEEIVESSHSYNGLLEKIEKHEKRKATFNPIDAVMIFNATDIEFGKITSVNSNGERWFTHSNGSRRKYSCYNTFYLNNSDNKNGLDRLVGIAEEIKKLRKEASEIKDALEILTDQKIAEERAIK